MNFLSCFLKNINFLFVTNAQNVPSIWLIYFWNSIPLLQFITHIDCVCVENLWTDKKVCYYIDTVINWTKEMHPYIALIQLPLMRHLFLTHKHRLKTRFSGQWDNVNTKGGWVEWIIARVCVCYKDKPLVLGFCGCQGDSLLKF